MRTCTTLASGIATLKTRHIWIMLSFVGWMLFIILPITQGQPQSTRASEIQRILHQAISIASTLTDREARFHALLHIAEAQAMAGDAAGALKTIRDIPNGHDAGNIRTSTGKDNTLAAIAIAQAKAGDIAGGLKTINLIKELGRETNGKALGEIALIQAKSQDFEGAQRTVASIQINSFDGSEPREEVYSKVHYYGVLAGVETNAGHAENAAKALHQARQTAEIIKDKSHRDWVQTMIVDARIETGDITGAVETATTIKDNDARSDAFRLVVCAQVARQDIASALKTLNSIQNKGLRAQALLVIASAQAKAGDRQNAAKTLKEAEQLVPAIEDDDTRLGGFSTIALVQAQMGDMETALKTAKAQNPFVKNLALTAIARFEGQVGDIEAVRKTIVVLENQADLPAGNNYLRYQGCLLLAAAQAQAKDLPEASKTLQRAIQLAVSEKDVTMRDANLAIVAREQAQFGIVADALKTSEMIKDVSFRCDSFQEVAAAQAKIGKGTEAIRWIEALASPVEKVYALLGVVEGRGEEAKP